MLKSANFNQFRTLPIQLFECSDVFTLDNQESNDVGCTMKRHLSALYGGVVDGFSNLHGLLDKVAARLGWKLKLELEDDANYIKGRRAAVYNNGQKVGFIGVPTVEIL